MAKTYNKLKIDIKEKVNDLITAKQNDSNSRFLDVYLYDGGVPIDLTGHEVRIYMQKPDGTEIFNNGEITDAASGRCQFELTDQALGAYGKLLCEISIWYDNVQILTSPTFDIHVVKNLRTAGSIESSNEYGALVVLYQNLYEAIDLMTTMVEQFGEPGDVATAASIATFWQMLEYLYDVNNNALANSSTQGVIDLIGATGDTGGSATAGTVFAKLNAIISSYLANSTYGLSALKTLIDSNKGWHAAYGTGITLASKTTATSTTVNTDSNYTSGTKVLAFVAPENGEYRFDVTMTLTNKDSSDNGRNSIAYVRLIETYGSSNISSYYILKEKVLELDSAILNTATSGTIAFGAYLEKGRSYHLDIHYYRYAGSTICTCNSAYVKYTKKTN